MMTTKSYINIGDIHSGDEYYRYKMPIIETTIEGKGNGVKTRIININDIAQALNRPPLMIMKFYSSTLGTSVQQGNILRGNHTKDVLSKHLNTFINEYVLCKTCTNPETTLRVKTNALRGSCKACGEKYFINETIGSYESIFKMFQNSFKIK